MPMRGRLEPAFEFPVGSEACASPGSPEPRFHAGRRPSPNDLGTIPPPPEGLRRREFESVAGTASRQT